MAMTARRPASKPLVGQEKPRLAPPVPARSQVADFIATSDESGIALFPWQRRLGRYLYALAPDDRWLYPEVAAVVSRQNGKTTVLKPHIMRRLKMGRRILHAAQTRELPRMLFDELIPLVQKEFGFRARIRRGAGQETIQIDGGGSYKIVAASGGAPRGLSIDDLLLDEVRELDSIFVDAAIPTTMASPNPQILYLSNAGSETTLALNAIRARASDDPNLAYLEWSAAPERAVDDPVGWAEGNPAMGHIPSLLDTLQRRYTSARLGGSLAAFETENLCRWVSTMREKLVDPFAWSQLQSELPAPKNAVMAVSMSPDGSRASAVVAWAVDENTYGLRLLFNVTGNPIDTGALGEDMKKASTKLGIRRVGYDPLTDGELAKYFPKPESLSGQKFANASAQFVNLVNASKLRWADADPVGDDLTWTSRKHDHETGSFQAVRAQDDRPITASLAAIRAVWLASGPKPVSPKVVT